MALDFFHPSTARLRSFLETGQSDKVALHVEQCERCADRLVELDDELDNEDVANGGESNSVRTLIVEALSSAYTAPEDLNDRLVAHVERRSKNERELALFAGLMTIGVDTAKLMANAEDDGGRGRYGPDGVVAPNTTVSERDDGPHQVS